MIQWPLFHRHSRTTKLTFLQGRLVLDTATTWQWQLPFLRKRRQTSKTTNSGNTSSIELCIFTRIDCESREKINILLFTLHAIQNVDAVIGIIVAVECHCNGSKISCVQRQAASPLPLLCYVVCTLPPSHCKCHAKVHFDVSSFLSDWHLILLCRTTFWWFQFFLLFCTFFIASTNFLFF